MYNFKKIKYKKDTRVSPGEEQTFLDGNHEDFATVKAKYEWLAKNTNYGASNGHDGCIHRANIVKPFLQKNNFNSALDIGTGQGYFCNILKEYCETVYGLDFAIKPASEKKPYFTYINKDIKFINSDAHAIPLEDNSVELITSFDFLEHVHPDYLEKTIKEMFRVGSKYMLHSIYTGPSSSHFKQCGQLHVIQESVRKFWKKEVFEPHAKSVEYLGRHTLGIII